MVVNLVLFLLFVLHCNSLKIVVFKRVVLIWWHYCRFPFLFCLAWSLVVLCITGTDSTWLKNLSQIRPHGGFPYSEVLVVCNMRWNLMMAHSHSFSKLEYSTLTSLFTKLFLHCALHTQIKASWEHQQTAELPLVHPANVIPIGQTHHALTWLLM